jgi:hypothetical protein
MNDIDDILLDDDFCTFNRFCPRCESRFLFFVETKVPFSVLRIIKCGHCGFSPGYGQNKIFLLYKDHMIKKLAGLKG